MPLFNFKCEKCGETTEHITKSDVAAITCNCGGLMKKQIGSPLIKLDGTNPDFPGAYNKWGSVREERAKQARKKSYFRG